MFDNRCMYYLTIVVVMLFSVSFIKLNKFWELDVRYGEVESDESMGTTIFKGVRFLIGIVLILMPGIMNPVYQSTETSVYKGYKQDKIEMRGDRAEMSDFPLYLNTVAGGLDRRNQAISGFSFVVKIYAVPVVEIIG